MLKDGIPVHRASKQLSMKYSTAKGIMQLYYRTGKITLKNIRQEETEISSEQSGEENIERVPEFFERNYIKNHYNQNMNPSQ